LTVNDEVVHGIPREIRLKEGDVLGVDLGALYHGWHTDTAWSVVVGGKQTPFLAVGEEALWVATSQAVEGNRLGDISAAIQKKVEEAGFAVVKNYTGHGVGRSPHEEPTISGVGKAGTGLILKEGMIFAIEVIYTSGQDDVYEKEDGWTVATVDGSLGGLFEMTVIVGKEKPEVITDFRKV
jgi:methionyl aminopeptidase